MPKEYTIQQPLTPQEISLFSRYGNNNFSADAFYNNQGLSSDTGLFTPIHFQNQDELNNKKHKKSGGDYRNTIPDFRKQYQRFKEHSSLYYQTPYM